MRNGSMPHTVRAGVLICTLTCAAAALCGCADHQSGGRITGPRVAPPTTAIASPNPRQAEAFTSTLPQRIAAGTAGNTEVSTPVDPKAFRAPITRYRTFATRHVAALARHAHALTAALRRGDRDGARAAWDRADSAFARIGAAYGALGTLGDAINGAPGGLPGGQHDHRFTGLQRIEQGLWSATPPPTLVSVGVTLESDVARLSRVLRTTPITPLQYATRAHEILEDVQRDRLSFRTPSDSGVRATADGLAATRKVLDTLKGLLAGRGDATARSEFWLQRLGSTLETIRRSHGGYPAVAQLSRGERERLNGRLGAALEALAGIPDELETTGWPAIPRLPR